jgi:uncharacterized LabA/DUF88 family protein
MTAVENLNQLLKTTLFINFEKYKFGKKILKVSTELFEQQIKDAYNQGYRYGQKNWDIILKNDIKEYLSAENYYNETFNK